MKESYIGITDFSDARQVLEMLEVLRQYRRPNSNRKLMVGVMMSHKTLNNLPSSWLGVFPQLCEYPSIFQFIDPDLMNTLHYADFRNADADDLADNLRRATECCNAQLDALQLDMLWPDPQVVIEYRQSYPDIQIVLQAGRQALERIENDPWRLRKKVAEYEDAVDYVLLDRSMGEGKLLDADSLKPFIDEMVDHRPDVGMAFAGGLGPETMEPARPLLEAYPFLSYDAQGRMRPSQDAHDPVDWSMARHYLISGLSMSG